MRAGRDDKKGERNRPGAVPGTTQYNPNGKSRFTGDAEMSMVLRYRISWTAAAAFILLFTVRLTNR